MKNKGFFAGLLCGTLIFGGTTAYAAGVIANLSTQPIYVDGQRVSMTAYSIGGNNYVKLRDIGEKVGFNVYWDNATKSVQVRSDAPYAEEETLPVKSEIPTPEAPTMDAVKQDIVDRTNALRAENGIAALAADDLLMQAAQVRAEEMAATNLYSHTRPNGKSFFTVTDVPYMAENIHCIWDSPDSPMAVDVVALWSRSEGHRKNMLNGRVDSIGIGIAAGIDENGVGCSYCVQLFLYEGNRITWVDTPICSIP